MPPLQPLCVGVGVAGVVVAVLVTVDVETTAATMVGSRGSNVVRDVGSRMVTRFCVFGVWVGSDMVGIVGIAGIVCIAVPLRFPLMVGGGAMLRIRELGTKST